MAFNFQAPAFAAIEPREGWTAQPLASLCKSAGGMFKFGVRIPAQELAMPGGDHALPGLGTLVRENFAVMNSNFRLRAGDVVCNRRGDLTRRILVQSDSKQVIADIDCLLVRLPECAVSSQYLYYYMEHSRVTRWLQRESSGKSTPQLNKRMLGKLPVVYPGSKIQREFCDALDAIDRKIEINRAINQTLNEKARTLLIESLNDQPLKTRSCSELCTRMENGRTPKKNEPAYWSPPTIPWITSSEVRQGIILQAAQSISSKGLMRTYMKTWPKGAIIVALCGETAGQVARLAITSSGNQACCAVMPKPGFEDYLYVYLKNAGDALNRLRSGAALRSLNQKILADFPISIPSPARLDDFNHLVKPMLEKLEQNIRQTFELCALRRHIVEKLIPQ